VPLLHRFKVDLICLGRGFPNIAIVRSVFVDFVAFRIDFDEMLSEFHEILKRNFQFRRDLLQAYLHLPVIYR
jgi:hypothetical protein